MDLREKLTKRLATKNDIKKIESILRSDNLDDIKSILVPYIKYVENIDEEYLISLCYKFQDEYIVSEIIKCLGYWRYNSAEYKKLVLHFCNQVDWDFDDDIILACLGRLPNLFALDEVSNILRTYFVHTNPVVKDAAVYAAQFLFNLDKNEIQEPLYDGKFIDEVSHKVRYWFHNNE